LAVFLVRSSAGGLRATNWITEVNGTPTRDLDAFLAVVSSIGHGVDVRVMCVDLADRKRVFTLRTDTHYWRTVELRRVGDGEAWTCRSF
jgi:C-terminal processing protease CtpA/Prc